MSYTTSARGLGVKIVRVVATDVLGRPSAASAAKGAAAEAAIVEPRVEIVETLPRAKLS